MYIVFCFVLDIRTHCTEAQRMDHTDEDRVGAKIGHGDSLLCNLR